MKNTKQPERAEQLTMKQRLERHLKDYPDAPIVFLPPGTIGEKLGAELDFIYTAPVVRFGGQTWVRTSAFLAWYYRVNELWLMEQSGYNAAKSVREKEEALRKVDRYMTGVMNEHTVTAIVVVLRNA